MKLPLYQIDAFASAPFTGNPAAVCPLDAWLDDGLMQAIAMEMQLSETAFFVREGDGFGLRWFTPVCEVDLCGHATLAAGHVLFAHLGHAQGAIRFATRSGELRVRRNEDASLSMDFPRQETTPCAPPPALLEGLRVQPADCHAGADWLVRLDSENTVRALAPEMRALRQLDRRAVIITAQAEAGDTDFVSRFFAPKAGIDEDPVTGSAHCALAPYWAHVLGKTELTGRQLSTRGGRVACRIAADTVELTGHAVTVLEGRLHVPD